MSTFPIAYDSAGLEKYIQQANAIPLLTQQQEAELANRFLQENDLDAARELVLSHLRVVISIARSYTGYGLPQADLIQEGAIGLMKAVKRFEPSRGVRLFSFAIHWIKAEIHEYILRNWRLVKIATTKAQRKLFFNLRTMKKHLRSLSYKEAEEIAQNLKVKTEEVLAMEVRISAQDIPLVTEDADEEVPSAPIFWLADTDSEPTKVLEQRDQDRLTGKGIASALSNLDSRSRRIIEARWLNDEEGVTLHDLAAEFKVSAERIRQIETKALQKMKVALLSFGA